MLDSSNVNEIEKLVSLDSDEELEDILLEHYAVKADYLAAEAADRLHGHFDFDSCNPQRFRALFRF